MKREIENKVIGIVLGKTIVKNENNDYFYTEIPMEYIQKGEHVFEEDLIPLNKLGTMEMIRILKAVNRGDENGSLQ